MADRTIQEVLADNADEWMTIPGVVGAAQGQSEGRFCIVIFASGDGDAIRARIGETVEGYHVIIQKTGDFHAL